MPKQVMDYNKHKLYILFCIIYITQLTHCKVSLRRQDGDDDPNGNQLNESDGSETENPTETGFKMPTETPNPEETGFNMPTETPNPEETGFNMPTETPNPEETGFNMPTETPNPEETGFNMPTETPNPEETGFNMPTETPNPEETGFKMPTETPNPEETGFNMPTETPNPEETGFKMPTETPNPEETGFKMPTETPNPEETGFKTQTPDPEKKATKFDNPNALGADGENPEKESPHVKGGADNGCWISFNEQRHFEKMSQLERKYKVARDEYQKNAKTQQFDQRMLEAMAQTRGIAERALQKFRGNPNVIPAGLNLGSYCMMRMPQSMLFFYRLKLRNNTRFTVNFLHNDLSQMTLTLRISLNDLHLVGEYERALTSDVDPSKLFFRPNKGEVAFFLQDVKYKVEGRYRLINGRLHIEHIISEIPPMKIIMQYTTPGRTDNGRSIPVDPNSLRDYLNRMQVDLDRWLKDYFNDFLMLYGSPELEKNNEIQEYENEKTLLLNQFSDEVMDILNGRLKKVAPTLSMPDFVLTAANGMEVRLYNGVVRGLDTMHRRSVATSKPDNEVRHVDADIGFSKLKSEYRYEVFVRTGLPPVSGVFVLNSDDVTAHMALQIVGYKPSVPDLLITFEKQGKPESLTVEGAASRIISNFKHLLEHHIISLMTGTLIHHIRSLSALPKCDPQLASKDKVTKESRHSTWDYEDDQTTQMNPQDDDVVTPPNDDEDERSDNKDVTYPGSYEDPTPTQQPDNNDDGPTEKPYSENDDDPTKKPDNKSDDDGPTEPSSIDTVPSEPAESDDDDPTESPDYTKEPSNGDDVTEPPYPNDKKPEYAFERKESIELELPSKDGSPNGESYKIDHNETFSLTKLNNDDRKVLSAVDETHKVDNRGKVVKLNGRPDVPAEIYG